MRARCAALLATLATARRAAPARARPARLTPTNKRRGSTGPTRRSSEPARAPPSPLLCRRSRARPAKTGTTVTSTALSGSSYGVHTVTCTAKDASGNVSAAVTFKVTVLQPLTVRIQPPLSGDNDTVDKIVKDGTTVPTKVQLYACGANLTTTASVVAKVAVPYVPSGACQCQQSRHDDLDRRCRHERGHAFRRHVLPLRPGYEGLLRDRRRSAFFTRRTSRWPTSPHRALWWARM